jgi:hypothetical protein
MWIWRGRGCGDGGDWAYRRIGVSAYRRIGDIKKTVVILRSGATKDPSAPRRACAWFFAGGRVQSLALRPANPAGVLPTHPCDASERRCEGSARFCDLSERLSACHRRAADQRSQLAGRRSDCPRARAGSSRHLTSFAAPTARCPRAGGAVPGGGAICRRARIGSPRDRPVPPVATICRALKRSSEASRRAGEAFARIGACWRRLASPRECRHDLPHAHVRSPTADCEFRRR